MNIAGKGVLLIIAVITVGIIVLNQGFDKDNSATSAPVPSTQEPQDLSLIHISEPTRPY